MGRRRTRKAERRLQQRGRAWWEDTGPGRGADFPPAAPLPAFDPGDAWADDPWDDGDLLAAFSGGRGTAATRTCGDCREFVEDGELGRGTCLHPGSGVLHPWTDTAGCDFWSRGGRR
ncbi:hypothetical protein [Tepidiforma sp.]|uniref:hypothetical protein n=1 Tax=Tepidiforma sp. TaxID=2682230 RepID=UPI00261FDAB2|nr:hypothetical protein [Tepidiforma sp.]MCX7616409.1 hypothetical protein [Tepidiforma sp.]